MNLPLISQAPPIGLRCPSPISAPSLERRRLHVYTAQMLLDVVVLFGSFATAGLLYHGSGATPSVLLPANLMVPIYLTMALQNRSYSLGSLQNWREAAMRALSALFISAVLVNFVAFFAKLNAVFSRGAFVIAIGVAALALVILRKISVGLIHRRWGQNPINVLLVDDGGTPVNIPNVYRISAIEYGLQPTLDNPHTLDLFARCVRNMDQVIISCPPERHLAWAMVLKGSGVHGEVLANHMREIGALGVVNRDEANITTLLVSTGPLGLRDRALKRAVDIAASLAAVSIALPILLVAAVAIKLEDGGPVLFRQNRVGRRNQLFRIYKLRTMKVESTDSDGNRSSSRSDDRVTRVGRLLRRTSIDELPQLFNVLRGDMSLVGPRPHAIGSLAGDKLFWEIDPCYWQRHSLRPGLTGLAQVRGLRGATDREGDLIERLQADLEYISGWTILRDIRILVATSLVLIHDRAF